MEESYAICAIMHIFWVSTRVATASVMNIEIFFIAHRKTKFTFLTNTTESVNGCIMHNDFRSKISLDPNHDLYYIIKVCIYIFEYPYRVSL